ncbi:MAG: SPOR domain-containing protein [Bacteroidales bacterium]|nr:SPOR domain-containing protein [Bacteroidales bacterium]MDD3201001.1 SPOR domain-containing protein [Bacteroidales bacterium]
MKLFRILTILLLSVMMLSGCDFFRSLLGKPTSEDIALLRAEKEREIAQERDSLAKIQAAQVDSAAVQPQAPQKPEVQAPQKPGTITVTHSNPHRYYVVVGAFQDQNNAAKYSERLKKDNMEVTNFKFKNGYNVVAVGGFETIAEANSLMNKVAERDDCPDPWVYDANTARHE